MGFVSIIRTKLIAAGCTKTAALLKLEVSRPFALDKIGFFRGGVFQTSKRHQPYGQNRIVDCDRVFIWAVSLLFFLFAG
jgi:hypothetical protein